MNAIVKRMLVHTTRAMFRHLYNGKYEEHNQCLRWAGLTRYVFLAMQRRNLIPKTLCPLIQAGTAQWRYRKGLDDDICFFGYEIDRIQLLKHVQEQLPAVGIEWHVWVGVRETQEIIDLTTPHQPRQLRETAVNMPRDTPWDDECALPDFIWLSGQEADEKHDWIYFPDDLACIIAANTWDNTIRIHDLQTPASLANLFAYCLATFRP